MKSFLTFFLFGCLFPFTFSLHGIAGNGVKVDSFKDYETRMLYRNLKKFSDEGVMFGMANPTTISYKGGPKNNDIKQSDCKDITGSHPAFHESDFMWYQDSGGKSFMKTDIQALQEACERGALIGYCWHLRGPESGSFYAKKDGDFTRDKDLVKSIVNGPSDRSQNASLDWLLSLLDNLVIPVFQEINSPVLFRPFHEMNGNWFWWGSDNCTPQEYQQLYRIVVDYLRKNEIYNVLYVWSPDTKAAFEYYPGHDYVDIVGMDIYEPCIAKGKPREKVVSLLREISRFAQEHDKVAAWTETGLRKKNGVFLYPEVYPEFWTQNVLDVIQTDSLTQKIAYVMSWYSADWQNDGSGQFYIPYEGIITDYTNGEKAVDDFIEFYRDPFTFFEDRLPGLYAE